jgi:large subunit ribosomal protein L4
VFIGGGKAHGQRTPHFRPRLLNKKVRALGLKMALSSKAKDGAITVLDNLDVKDGKTKVLAGQLARSSV